MLGLRRNRRVPFEFSSSLAALGVQTSLSPISLSPKSLCYKKSSGSLSTCAFELGTK